MLESQLLSKVLEEKDFHILNKFNINADDFFANRDAYEFVRDYVRSNGSTPDVRTVAMKFENFEYVPETSDSFKYLASTLKSNSAKRSAFDLLQNKAGKNFKEMDGTTFAKWLKEEVVALERVASASSIMGVDFAKNGQERKELYLERKEHKELSYIPTPYPTLNKLLNGGFVLGDYVLLQAFTNQGKSFVCSDIGLSAFNAGFNVLHYSIELPKVQQLQRLDTLNAHFQNSKMARGELQNEAEYFKYLDKFNHENKQKYIVKSMEDLPDGLTLDVMEADLNIYKPNLLIIDGFNLIKHKGGSSNMRNSLSQTSRDLRQMFGRHNVCGLVVHQSSTQGEKDRKSKDDVENVIVEPPSILDYSETSSVIQDSSVILSFAQANGNGKISIEKARVPKAKGEKIELHCDFDNGYITEVQPSDYF